MFIKYMEMTFLRVTLLEHPTKILFKINIKTQIPN